MSTISLTDGFGLVIDAAPSGLSAFSKYLKNPESLVAQMRTKKPITGLRIGDDPFGTQSIGICFTQPVGLGVAGIELTISPQAVATIGVKKGQWLFDSLADPFRDKIAIPANQAFLSFALKARLDLGLGDKTGDLQFGFATGSEIVFTNYRLFSLTDELVPGIQSLLENFVIPGDLQDMESMAAGSIATVEGAGSLKFSAAANLLSVVNPLASAGTAIIQAALQVSAGAAVCVAATYTLKSEYQVRVQRMPGRKFRLGYETKPGAEFDVSVAAETGIGVPASDSDFNLIHGILEAISPDPVPPKDAFTKAGLSEQQLSTISTAVKTGIERGLQLALIAELNSLAAASAAFSYEVDPSALDPRGRQAIHEALDGNLSGLESGNLDGVKPVTSVFSALRQGKEVLKINLLGIYNAGSVATLLQEGTLIVDQESGEITISDKASMDRIQFTSSNFAKSSGQLRRVLAESFLITAAYRASGTVRVGPGLTSSLWFFALNQRANLQNIRDYLNIARVLDLVSPDQVQSDLQSVNTVSAFGQCTFYAGASYPDAILRSLFIGPGEKPWDETEYEAIGRRALALLLPSGGPVNDARRLPLTDNQVWEAMKSKGQPGNFEGVFDGYSLNANQLADIASDYTLVTWWAAAMYGMSVALAALLAYTAANPQWDSENNTFKRLRQDLDRAMTAVVGNTKNEFGEPWGLVALNLAANGGARTEARLVCSHLCLALSNHPSQAVAVSTTSRP
jgi:hypothetical protein